VCLQNRILLWKCFLRLDRVLPDSVVISQGVKLHKNNLAISGLTLRVASCRAIWNDPITELSKVHENGTSSHRHQIYTVSFLETGPMFYDVVSIRCWFDSSVSTVITLKKRYRIVKVSSRTTTFFTPLLLSGAANCCLLSSCCGPTNRVLRVLFMKTTVTTKACQTSEEFAGNESEAAARKYEMNKSAHLYLHPRYKEDLYDRCILPSFFVRTCPDTAVGIDLRIAQFGRSILSFA
jgi:hypothetical protein